MDGICRNNRLVEILLAGSVCKDRILNSSDSEIGGNSVQIQSVPDILDENFGCVTVTKPGCRTDESVRHVTGHRGCRIDSNGTV